MDAQIDLGQINSNRQKLAHATGVLESVETRTEFTKVGEDLAKGIGEVISRLEPIVKMVDEFAKVCFPSFTNPFCSTYPSNQIHPYLDGAWKILTSAYHVTYFTSESQYHSLEFLGCNETP